MPVWVHRPYSGVFHCGERAGGILLPDTAPPLGPFPLCAFHLDLHSMLRIEHLPVQVTLACPGNDLSRSDRRPFHDGPALSRVSLCTPALSRIVALHHEFSHAHRGLRTMGHVGIALAKRARQEHRGKLRSSWGWSKPINNHFEAGETCPHIIKDIPEGLDLPYRDVLYPRIWRGS